MSTTLARFNLQNGVPQSVTLDAVYPLRSTEYFLLYTVSAVQYGDVFDCQDFDDQQLLIESYKQQTLATVYPIGSAAGEGSGTRLNAVLQAGGPTAISQPEVVSVQNIAV